MRRFLLGVLEVGVSYPVRLSNRGEEPTWSIHVYAPAAIPKGTYFRIVLGVLVATLAQRRVTHPHLGRVITATTPPGGQ